MCWWSPSSSRSLDEARDSSGLCVIRGESSGYVREVFIALDVESQCVWVVGLRPSAAALY